MPFSSNYRRTAFQEILKAEHDGTYPEYWRAALANISRSQKPVKEVFYQKKTVDGKTTWELRNVTAVYAKSPYTGVRDHFLGSVAIKSGGIYGLKAAGLDDGKLNKFTVRALWEAFAPKIREIYDNFKVVVPYLMSYRYKTQIFDHLTNKDGFIVTNYTEPQNKVLFKAIPVMNASNLYDLFVGSYDASHLYGGLNFSYKYCVVELEPNVSSYNPNGIPDNQKLQADQFPMKFVRDIDEVNVNQYKTNKILLQNVMDLSSTNVVKFSMGSRPSDYDQVDDVNALKYADEESIVEQAPDDKATVTLGNSGSYQKKKLKTPDG